MCGFLPLGLDVNAFLGFVVIPLAVRFFVRALLI